LSLDSFLDALRARRVFATEDKTAQVVLTANGHVMGERFSNSGPLTLTVDYASSSGQTAQRVQVFEGVPGSSGTVGSLSETATTTLTPTTGDHFYYAKITQVDGLQLWSAPVWVSQGSDGGSGDTTAPTASASESGGSGTITFNATASDDVGVMRVEFYVDGALKATDTSSPYSATLDSTTLADGTHALIAKAYDAAGNVGSSGSTSFSVSNSGTTTQLISNGSFESGSASWTQSSGVITSDSGEPAHAGNWKAWLDGYGASHTDYVRQKISIPAGVSSATLDFFIHVDSAEPKTTAYDNLQVQVITSTGKVLTLATFSNKDAAAGFQEHAISLNGYKGQTLQVNFNGVEDSTKQTSFVIDDVSVKTQ
jgi:hypothetical protein